MIIDITNLLKALKREEPHDIPDAGRARTFARSKYTRRAGRVLAQDTLCQLTGSDSGTRISANRANGREGRLDDNFGLTGCDIGTPPFRPAFAAPRAPHSLRTKHQAPRTSHSLFRDLS